MIGEKKQLQIALGIVIIIAIVSGVFNITQLVIYTLPERKSLIYSTRAGPVDLDPQFSWDSASNDVIMQVTEGLLAYDLTDPELKIIPRLATSYVWEDTTHIRFYLRENVFFHDGAEFTADAVKWTFERMLFWCNATSVNPPHITQLHSLYEFPDGTPIMKSITAVNDYEVLIELNRPFAAFTALLCYTGSSILSPTSHPEHEQLDTAEGILIGTGPFVYDHYISDVEVRFHRYERYWQTGPYFEEIIYSIYMDHATAEAQMLIGEFDMIDSLTSYLYPQVDADPLLHREDFGKGLVIHFLGFNNKHITINERFAMSHALNYSYIIEKLCQGAAYRMTSFVPEGIYMHDPTIVPPDYDVKKAREYMKLAFPAETAGLTANDDISSGNEWEALTLSDPIITYNYTYNTGSWLRKNLLPLLTENFTQIGIELTDAGMSWDEYTDRFYNIGATSAGWESLQVFWLDWSPDYNDPDNFLNPLVSNTSDSNPMQVNDPHVQQKLAEGLAETDDVARRQIYSDLQHYLTEELCPVAPSITTAIQYVHVAKLKGFAYNAMQNIEWYPCYFEE